MKQVIFLTLLPSLPPSLPPFFPQAEENYEALKKYGHDLVADAEESKLDPVIGRDEEIRRVIQVNLILLLSSSPQQGKDAS